MPLYKRLRCFRSPFTVSRRFYSCQPASPYTFRNLRAFPFKLSPYDAQRYLSPYAAVVRHEKLIESVLARFLPGMGFEPIKPVRFVPVYFPSWIVDVEVTGEVTYKGDDYQASAQIHNAYIPGSDYKVLSSAPLAPLEDIDHETVPFSDDLLRQFDLDVACIPYNISPFSILDIARHLSYSEATIAQGFRFNPSSLKPTLFAAYPVLVPVYLAQYEYGSDAAKYYHTFFIEAYAGTGNVWSEPFGPQLSVEQSYFERFRSYIATYNEPLQSLVNLGYPKRFIDITGFSHTPHQELGHAIKDYLENALNLAGTPTTLAAASVNDMESLTEDGRVREFSTEDRTPIIEWLKLGAELMMVQRMHEAMSKARDGGQVRVIGIGSKENEKMNYVGGAIQHLADQYTSLRTQRQQIKPAWAKSEEELLEKCEAEKLASTGSQPDKDPNPS